MEEVEYYITHKSEFEGEAGHEKLMPYLTRYAPVLSVPTLGIDVGANIGNEFESIRGLLTESTTKLIAIEPNPLNVEILEEKKKTVAFDLHAVALSDTKGTLPFYTYKNIPENKAGYSLAGLRAGGKKITDVVVTTLDSILEDYPEYIVKYLKIDTEGNDTLVLRGAQKNLHRIHYILFEASDCLKDFRGPGEKEPLRNCVEMLDAAGFDVYKIGTHRLLKINGSSWDRTYDVLIFWSNCFALRKCDTILQNFIDTQGFYV
jgi:FkbM family methyltransferase